VRSLLAATLAACAGPAPGASEQDLDGGPVTPAAYDDCQTRDPHPAQWTDAGGLHEREGSVGFVDRAGRELRAFTWRASGYAPADGPILFAIHGAERDPGVLVDALAPAAERAGALLIAPYFDEDLFASVEDFTLGVGVDGPPEGADYDPALWLPRDDYVYSEIEHLFEAIREALGSDACGYLLAGSAEGAEFVHRLLIFRPDARVARAAAANAGWYTLPSDGSAEDPAYFMPYGLGGSPVTGPELGAAFGRELVVLVGEGNTGWPDGPDGAAGQGDDAWGRAGTFLEVAEGAAARMEVPLRWRRAEMNGVDDEHVEIGPELGWWLFDGDEASLCAPDGAGDVGGLVFNEILADPDRSVEGDANGDGRSDGDQDDFVELLNTGERALCLAGWTLSDAGDTRHVFPADTSLGPGEALVVFGGGVPTGEFGGAHVQWAALDGELSLSSGGDVLTLSDAGGQAALRVSWGDCADRDCAPDHALVDLYEEQSATRDPDGYGAWRLHRTVARRSPFSPGTRADGRRF